jgi:hypothetical protein
MLGREGLSVNGGESRSEIRLLLHPLRYWKNAWFLYKYNPNQADGIGDQEAG